MTEEDNTEKYMPPDWVVKGFQRLSSINSMFFAMLRMDWVLICAHVNDDNASADWQNATVLTGSSRGNESFTDKEAKLALAAVAARPDPTDKEAYMIKSVGLGEFVEHNPKRDLN